MKILDFDKIKSLNLSAEEMYSWTENVWKQQDSFILPPKSKMLQGESGRYFTMPCVLPQYDISGVKFICRNVDDVDGVPARNSNIMLQIVPNMVYWLLWMVHILLICVQELMRRIMR